MAWAHFPVWFRSRRLQAAAASGQFDAAVIQRADRLATCADQFAGYDAVLVDLPVTGRAARGAAKVGLDRVIRTRARLAKEEPIPVPVAVDPELSLRRALAPEGDTVVYTIGVTNLGPDDASGVVVTDSVPAGLTFVSAVPGQGSWSTASSCLSRAAPAQRSRARGLADWEKARWESVNSRAAVRR